MPPLCVYDGWDSNPNSEILYDLFGLKTVLQISGQVDFIININVVHMYA